MTEFKFACPHCGQHLSADERLGGHQIRCPTCAKDFVVRYAGDGTAPIPLSPEPEPPPPLPVRAQSYGLTSSSRLKRSGTAIASLTLSIVGLLQVFSPFTGIAAVICGHVAKSRIRAAAGQLQGRVQARWGLVLGYVGVCFWGLGLIVRANLPALEEARIKAHTIICVRNLEQIQSAKSQWAADQGNRTGVPVGVADLKMYFKDGKVPVCRTGGTYTIGAIQEPPSCSVPGHEFKPKRVNPRSN